MFYYCLRGKAIKKRANNVDNIFSFKIPVSLYLFSLPFYKFLQNGNISYLTRLFYHSLG